MSSIQQQNNTNIQQNPQTQAQIPSYQSIPKIRVIVRKRPLGKKEIAKNDTDIVEIRNNKQVVVKELKVKVDLTKYVEEHAFNFDLAFDENATNEQIYLQTVRPMIEAAFHKTKVTCFAYGQTGSGKTFTMMGNKKQIPGLYLLAAYDIFTLLQNYQGFSIWISFYEIYCGKLFDLLNERKILTAREDGKQNICITGLTEKNVPDLNILMQIIEYGLNSRTVGVTGANADSSRSHGIIQIKIKDSNLKDFGKISFIDLAGSERAADTIDVNKQTKFDGAEINKSLLALKECIRALDQDKKHTPFRGSKLTLVLRDSFIGNCKTLMIANISPALGCSEHTLNTLRYADRVKELRAKPDIKLGQGNVNLNFIKNDKIGMPEDLATIMMMPRQHDNTIKYEVDNNMQKIKKLKTIKSKNNKTPHKRNENNGTNISNYNNNLGMINNNNSMYYFNNLPPFLNNNQNYNQNNNNDNLFNNFNEKSGNNINFDMNKNSLNDNQLKKLLEENENLHKQLRILLCLDDEEDTNINKISTSFPDNTQHFIFTPIKDNNNDNDGFNTIINKEQNKTDITYNNIQTEEIIKQNHLLKEKVKSLSAELNKVLYDHNKKLLKIQQKFKEYELKNKALLTNDNATNNATHDENNLIDKQKEEELDKILNETLLMNINSEDEETKKMISTIQNINNNQKKRISQCLIISHNLSNKVFYEKI
jgi:kinesin family protein 2/24